MAEARIQGHHVRKDQVQEDRVHEDRDQENRISTQSNRHGDQVQHCLDNDQVRHVLLLTSGWPGDYLCHSTPNDPEHEHPTVITWRR